jgi:hypothetical protein
VVVVVVEEEEQQQDMVPVVIVEDQQQQQLNRKKFVKTDGVSPTASSSSIIELVSTRSVSKIGVAPYSLQRIAPTLKNLVHWN